VRLAVPRLAGRAVSAGRSAARLAGGLRRPVRHGGEQRDGLPAAEPADFRRLGRPGPRPLWGGGPGPPLPVPLPRGAGTRAVGRLLGAAAGLGDRLGPVLLQLPPDFHADPGALDRCLAEFSRVAAAAGLRVRVAVEFRHDSWWTGEVRELLTRHGATLSWAD